MSGSIERVKQAAASAGLDVEIRRMGASTRTAEEAAQQCGCTVDQIVKSLIFEGKNDGTLYLFLLSGASRLDLAKAAKAAGQELKRADPRDVRDRTGFAIGGVAPIGYDNALPVYADRKLAMFDVVWAAAGAHDAVFSSEPNALIKAAGAEISDLAE
ncbi:YbaK/EbsC family protein [Mesorhizobium sp. Z1-4]|uniref:YbaK/EbsC family protein n=1 Tax=Mesorhizobium sp. Z1-4 TaxID=2448478 RepID=UPI000FD87687|nr:YbaK/EbsC family protein [Mesorhizobium sp. Z1-4]